MCIMQSCNAVTVSNSLALEPGLNEIYNWLSSAYAVCVYAGYRLRIHVGGGAALPQIACWHKL